MFLRPLLFFLLSTSAVALQHKASPSPARLTGIGEYAGPWFRLPKADNRNDPDKNDNIDIGPDRSVKLHLMSRGLGQELQGEGIYLTRNNRTPKTDNRISRIAYSILTTFLCTSQSHIPQNEPDKDDVIDIGPDGSVKLHLMSRGLGQELQGEGIYLTWNNKHHLLGDWRPLPNTTNYEYRLWKLTISKTEGVFQYVPYEATGVSTVNKIRRIVVLEHPPAEIQGLYVRLPQNGVTILDTEHNDVLEINPSIQPPIGFFALCEELGKTKALIPPCTRSDLPRRLVGAWGRLPAGVTAADRREDRLVVKLTENGELEFYSNQ